MGILIICIVLLIISFAAYSAMATLQFHYYQSIFSIKTIFKDQIYWNPLLSSNNKYKDWHKSNGEAFWGSTWIFVFLTDGYHLMQFIFENCLFLSIALYNTNYKYYLVFIGIRIIYGIVFNLFFDKLLLKK